MALATLTIDVEARMASLEKDMGKVAQLSEQTAKRMEGAFRSAGIAMGSVFAGIGAREVIGGFRNIVDQLDALNDAADATGASIENLSALEDIAKRNGTAFDDVTSILVKFNSVLKDASENNPTGQALKAIGLSAEELKRIDPAEALKQTADALSKYADDGNKARFIQDQFGKSVKDAAPFLKDLAEVQELQATVTAQQVTEAEKFNKQMAALDTVLGQIGRTLVSDSLPGLTALGTVLSENIKKAGVFEGTMQTIGQRIKEGLGLDDMSKTEVALQRTSGRLAAVTDEIVRLQGMVNKDPRSILEATVGRDGRPAMLATQRLAELRKEYGELQKVAAALSDKAKGSAGRLQYGAVFDFRGPLMPDGMKPTIDPPKGSEGNGGGGGGGGRPIKAASDFEKEMDRLKRLIESQQELTTLEQLHADIKQKRLKDLKPLQIEQLENAAREVDLLKDRNEQQQGFEALLKSIEDRESDRAARAAAYFDAALKPAEKLRRELEEIQRLYNSGAFKSDSEGTAEEKKARSDQAAKDKYTPQKGELKELNSTAKEFADTMLRAAENGDDLGKALERIAMKQFVFNPLSEALEGLFSNLTKNIGGNPLGDVFNSMLGSIFGGGRASGGPVAPGKLYEVNEREPEVLDVGGRQFLMMGAKGGTVIPRKAAGAASGSSAPTVIIQQTNHIGEGANRAEVYAAMQTAKEQAKQEILYSIQNRGAFA